MPSGKRKSPGSSTPNSKKPVHPESGMIFAWSQKASSELEANAAAKEAEEATRAAEAAQARAAAAAAAAATAAAASTAEKQTASSSTALVKAPAFPKPYNPDQVCGLAFHWHSLPNNRLKHPLRPPNRCE